MTQYDQLHAYSLCLNDSVIHNHIKVNICTYKFNKHYSELVIKLTIPFHLLLLFDRVSVYNKTFIKIGPDLKKLISHDL